jgi:hypothetical protein
MNDFDNKGGAPVDTSVQDGVSETVGAPIKAKMVLKDSSKYVKKKPS